MNPWRWVDPRIREVRLFQVRSYLESRGWRPVSTPSPYLLRYDRPSEGGGSAFYQMIPSSDEFEDFRPRITEFLTTLSEIEDRHPVALLDDILRQPDRPAVNGAPGPRRTQRGAASRSGDAS